MPPRGPTVTPRQVQGGPGTARRALKSARRGPKRRLGRSNIAHYDSVSASESPRWPLRWLKISEHGSICDLACYKQITAAPSLAPTLPWSAHLSWASFLDGLVGVREASTIQFERPCTSRFLGDGPPRQRCNGRVPLQTSCIRTMGRDCAR